MKKYYDVIESDGLGRLARIVEGLMKTGWTPVGGVSAYTYLEQTPNTCSRCVYYLQAMTLEEE
jgi:hypothetical protein